MPNDTATTASPLHMVQLRLDARRLAGLGQRLGLFASNRRVSTNYLVHCALGELFQEQAPKPFAVQDAPRRFDEAHDGRSVRVLGYTSAAGDALQELAKAFAPPAVYQNCDWDTLATKPMPATFPDGMRLRFELRACPVVRKSSAGEGTSLSGKKRTWRQGQELDAFLAEAWTSNTDGKLDREEVYCAWLARQFDARGGAEAGDISMERFSIERMTRRSHGSGDGSRAVQTVKKPDVTLTGTLRVTDGNAFAALLASGLGRHKSFGYGMLKVRRA